MSSLFALGSNGSGQLGVGHEDDMSVPTPTVELPKSPVIKLVGGGNHSVLLLKDGSLVSTGEKADGRCINTGHMNASQCCPVRDEGRYVHACQLVAATWAATIVVCQHGTVLVCGTGNSGELGLGSSVKVAERPTPIKGFPPAGTTIAKLAACMAHVVAVLSNGEVWGWGQGRKGQLGQPLDVVWEPRKIAEINFFAVGAACGKDFTCIVGNPSNGHIAVLGLHNKDRFGVISNTPTAIPGWKQVTASWGSIFVLLSSGKLLAWGRNDHGQLADPTLPTLAQITAGSEHCIGVTELGDVIAWGWGEHGNCGRPVDPDGNVRSRWNILEIPRPALAVFAGCATSFIAT